MPAAALYPLLLGACGRNVVFGQNVVLRHPHKIRIGDNVVVDDNCLLDAKGEGNAGITLGRGVFIGRNTILSCSNGDIEMADGVNIGFNCEVFSASRVTIGGGTLMAAYRDVVGGDHNFSDPTQSGARQTRTSAGISIWGRRLDWRRARSCLTASVVGERAIVGAGAVVRERRARVGGRGRRAGAGRPDNAPTRSDGVLAIVTSIPPAVEGGHLVIARASCRRAREAGHDARLIVTPDYGFGASDAILLANYRPMCARVDQVISLRYPSYACATASTCIGSRTRCARSTMISGRIPGIDLACEPGQRERPPRAHAHRRPPSAQAARDQTVHAVRDVSAPRGARFRDRCRSGLSAASTTWYRCDEYGDFVFAVSRWCR